MKRLHDRPASSGRACAGDDDGDGAPVLSLTWATLLLSGQLTWTTVVGGLAVILCARTAVRTRLSRSS